MELVLKESGPAATSKTINDLLEPLVWVVGSGMVQSLNVGIVQGHRASPG